MNSMNRLAEELGELIGYGKSYLEGKLEYVQLSCLERSTKLGGAIAFAVILSFVVLLASFFLFLALAAYLFTVLESMPLALLVTGGIILLLGILLYLLRKPLIMTPLLNIILDQISNTDDEEN